MDNDWLKDYFDEDYLYLYKTRLGSERTSFEVDFLIQRVFDQETRQILDIPCGFGRHAELLAQRKYIVKGVDNSKLMIQEASKRLSKLSKGIQKRLDYEISDMRVFSKPDSFDAVLNLFTSFGYFENSKENKMVLENLCISAKVGGIVVLDIRNLALDITEFSSSNWTRESKIDDVTVVQKLDPISYRHTLTYRYQKEGKKKEKVAVFQEYSLSEIKMMFKENNCVVEKTFGNFRGESYTPESQRLIVVARRNK